MAGWPLKHVDRWKQVAQIRGVMKNDKNTTSCDDWLLNVHNLAQNSTYFDFGKEIKDNFKDYS